MSSKKRQPILKGSNTNKAQSYHGHPFYPFYPLYIYVYIYIHIRIFDPFLLERRQVGLLTRNPH